MSHVAMVECAERIKAAIQESALTKLDAKQESGFKVSRDGKDLFKRLDESVENRCALLVLLLLMVVLVLMVVPPLRRLEETCEKWVARLCTFFIMLGPCMTMVRGCWCCCWRCWC